MVGKYIDGEKENECVFHAQMERRGSRSIVAGSQIFQMLNTITSNGQEIWQIKTKSTTNQSLFEETLPPSSP